jgi:DNA mismatch endonuclease Vsr
MPFRRFLAAQSGKRWARCCDMPGKQTRRFVSIRMGRVRSSGSWMERQIANELRIARIQFREQYPLIGKPDFVILKARIAIFCDSHFWHGYRWSKQKIRAFKINRAFWVEKIERNRRRDKLVNKELRKKGWKVIRFWEHQISRHPKKCILRIQESISKRRDLGQ